MTTRGGISLRVASFGDIRLQRTADNACAAVVNSSVLLAIKGRMRAHKSHAKSSARTRPGPICRNARPPRRLLRIDGGQFVESRLGSNIPLREVQPCRSGFRSGQLEFEMKSGLGICGHGCESDSEQYCEIAKVFHNSSLDFDSSFDPELFGSGGRWGKH